MTIGTEPTGSFRHFASRSITPRFAPDFDGRRRGDLAILPLPTVESARRSARPRAIALIEATSIPLGSGLAAATEGQIELNQTCAVETGFTLPAPGNVVGAGSVVTGSIATNNGLSGIAIQDRAGVPGGVIQGSSALDNGWSIALSGISVPAGGVALQNSVSANAGTGITANATSGIGLKSVSANGGVEVSNGIAIGCSVLDGVKTCP